MTALYVLRFRDGWILRVERSPHVDYYPQTFDISGGEQLRKDDFYLEAAQVKPRPPEDVASTWLRRAIFEEAFPLVAADNDADRHEILAARKSIEGQRFFSSIELSAIGYNVLDCSFPLFFSVISGWEHQRYLSEIERLRENRTRHGVSFRVDPEGRLFLFEEQSLDALVAGSPIAIKPVHFKKPPRGRGAREAGAGKDGMLRISLPADRWHAMTAARLYLLHEAMR